MQDEPEQIPTLEIFFLSRYNSYNTCLLTLPINTIQLYTTTGTITRGAKYRGYPMFLHITKNNEHY